MKTPKIVVEAELITDKDTGLSVFQFRYTKNSESFVRIDIADFEPREFWDSIMEFKRTFLEAFINSGADECDPLDFEEVARRLSVYYSENKL